MSTAWDEPVEVDENAPPLADGQEWVIPFGRPNERMVVQRIPDDAPPLIREGLARRRVQAVDGMCPCGGLMIWPDATPDPGVLRSVVAQHWGDCPAGDAVFVPAMLAWAQDRENG